MATQDDMTNCAVCLEEYDETGDQIPRILPCFHTLCQKCIQGLIQIEKETLECPECRQTHPAKDGVKTFMQNKYVVSYVRKSKAESEKALVETKKDKLVELCKKHKENAILYCRSEDCQTPICQSCLLESHRSHDFVDISAERDFKKKTLVQTVSSITRELTAYQVEVSKLHQLQELKNSNAMKKLFGAKEYLVSVIDKTFEKLENKLLDTFSLSEQGPDENRSLDEDLKNLRQIESICDKELTLEVISNELRKAELFRKRIGPKIRKGKTMVYLKYDGLGSEQDISRICGQLVETTFSIVEDLPDSENSPPSSIQMDIPKMDSVKALLVLSDGQVLILRKANDGRSQLASYEGKGKGVCILKEWRTKGPSSMTEVPIGGKHYLALCFRQEVKIELYLPEDLSSYRASYSTESNVCLEEIKGPITVFPGPADTLLWYEERESGSCQITVFSFDYRPSEFIDTRWDSIDDICYVNSDLGHHVVVLCHHKYGLKAYNLTFKNVIWRVDGDVGKIADFMPQNLASDGNGFIYVSDIGNKCIQQFSAGGHYLGSFVYPGHYELIEAHLGWCRKTSSLVIAHRKGPNWFIIKKHDLQFIKGDLEKGDFPIYF